LLDIRIQRTSGSALPLAGPPAGGLGEAPELVDAPALRGVRAEEDGFRREKRKVGIEGGLRGEAVEVAQNDVDGSPLGLDVHDGLARVAGRLG
jgi:hypothetical protein